MDLSLCPCWKSNTETLLSLTSNTLLNVELVMCNLRAAIIRNRHKYKEQRCRFSLKTTLQWRNFPSSYKKNGISNLADIKIHSSERSESLL